MTDEPELTPVRPAHRFDQHKLTCYLAAELGHSFDGMTVHQYEGGQSNPTYLVAADGNRYVLRKKPPGNLLKSAHMIEREYRVMNALRDTSVPVPRTHLLCEDDAVIGTSFFVMEEVPGRVFTDPMLSTMSANDRGDLTDDLVRLLAALHRIDYASAGLSNYGQPDNYLARQVYRWSRQYEASKTGYFTPMEELIRWLPEHIPPDQRPAIVHGDFRVGNCIVHPSEPRVVALLDWELSTIGDPLSDLAYLCLPMRLAAENEDNVSSPLETEILSRYCELTGRDRIENWNFYLIFSLFRSAAIRLGVYKRGLDGNASSEHWEKIGRDGVEAADYGWSLACRDLDV